MPLVHCPGCSMDHDLPCEQMYVRKHTVKAALTLVHMGEDGLWIAVLKQIKSGYVQPCSKGSASNHGGEDVYMISEISREAGEEFGLKICIKTLHNAEHSYPASSYHNIMLMLPDMPELEPKGPHGKKEVEWAKWMRLHEFINDYALKGCVSNTMMNQLPWILRLIRDAFQCPQPMDAEKSRQIGRIMTEVIRSATMLRTFFLEHWKPNFWVPVSILTEIIGDNMVLPVQRANRNTPAEPVSSG